MRSILRVIGLSSTSRMVPALIGPESGTTVATAALRRPLDRSPGSAHVTSLLPSKVETRATSVYWVFPYSPGNVPVFAGAPLGASALGACAAQRQHQRQAGPSSRLGVDVQPSAGQAAPLAHAVEPARSCGQGRADIEASPLVLDPHPQGPRAGPDVDVRFRHPRVPGHVGEGLLHEAEGGDLDLGVEASIEVSVVELHVDPR